MRVIQSKNPIKLWTDHVPVDDMALQQIMNISTLPFIYKHIAIMPDVHYGIGATVGSVIPTKGAIIPAAVGVDIGCGMMAAKTSLTAQDLIEAAIPVGLKEFSDDTVPLESDGVFDNATYNAIMQKHPQIQTKKHPIRQIGTLGSGNHFIELCLDKAGALWVMLHSGSRGVGNKIGTYFIDKAKEEMEKHHIMDSFIVRDLGNPESFHSCSHGAGRVMSRMDAKKMISLDQHITDTQGVECRKDENVIDETPKAYKNIDGAMKSQEDLVEIVYELKQILCVKG